MKPLALVVAAQLAILSVPRAAFADPQVAPRPAAPVQPVPYAQSQPVPYGQPAQPMPVQAPIVAVGPGNDVVILKSGGMIRGTLIEAVPNDHATVHLATGQNAIIQWDQIHHIERAGAATQAPAPAPVQAVPVQPMPAPIDMGTARVHIEADDPVVLERRSGPKGWQTVCTAPCDQEMQLGVEYRVTGPSIRASSTFHLNVNPGEQVTLEVHAASKGGFTGGIVLVSLGPIAMIVGLIVVAVETATHTSVDYATGQLVTSNPDSTAPGWTIALAGLGCTVGGVVMLVANGHSKVEQQPGVGPRAAASNAWTRLPTYREDSASLGMPKATAIPIFGGSF